MPNVAPSALTAADGGKNAPNLLSIFSFPEELSDAQVQLSGALEDVNQKTVDSDVSIAPDELSSEDQQNLPTDSTSSASLAANISPVAVPIWLMQPLTPEKTPISQGSNQLAASKTGVEPASQFPALFQSNALQAADAVGYSSSTLELQPIDATQEQISARPSFSRPVSAIEQNLAPYAAQPNGSIEPDFVEKAAAEVRSGTGFKTEISNVQAPSSLALNDVSVSQNTSQTTQSEQPEKTQASEELILGKPQQTATSVDSMPQNNDIPLVSEWKIGRAHV